MIAIIFTCEKAEDSELPSEAVIAWDLLIISVFTSFVDAVDLAKKYLSLFCFKQ